jgi:hypothetical protein
MPSTMSNMDDEWSSETPPNGYFSKRQMIDPEVQIRVTYPQQEEREDHMLHVLTLQAVMLSNHVDKRRSIEGVCSYRPQ